MQDGNIHCHIDNVSRRDRNHGTRVAVASAAYLSGQRIWSEVEQRFVEFSMREDVVFSEIVRPEGAPAWVADRAALWNTVDLTARRKDARLAKSIVAAITRDIPQDRRVALVRDFVAPFVALGCIADVAIHEDGTDHNPHLHVLLTTRRLTPDGFGDKLTALEQRSFVKRTRERWADLSNRYLEKAGSPIRVDHRSYRARGIEAEPTVHRGPNPMERRIKREHARRVREETTMSRPDVHERRIYPLLSTRETWPPEPEPSPDMTEQERDEHHRYWQDRQLDRLESAQQVEPDAPWFEQALDRARAEAGHVPDAERIRHEDVNPETLREQTWSHEDYDADVRKRAIEMKATREENEAFRAVRHEPVETRRFVQEFILHGRMQTIRDQDLARRLEQVQPELRAKLEPLRPQYLDWEHELPEPGPDREPRFRREMDQARDRMLEDSHREAEPEPPQREVSRDALERARTRMIEDYEREEDWGEPER